VATKLPYGDALNVIRRSTPLSVAAELLWQLLPPLTYTSRELVITAVLEPHDRAGGDGFDYAVDHKRAFCGIFDAVGHDLQAGQATAVALAAIRNARRGGQRDLVTLAQLADGEIITHGPRGRFVTAVLVDLDTSTGRLGYLAAGLAHKVLEHQGGLLQDDATLLMLDWRPLHPGVAPLPGTG
jgi:serine phosphatase RsbU (regulator of sigma subunit)